jgi:dephospho-CoA kinase
MILGVVGGIGSGKSTVARMLAEAGCDAVDADAVAHEVLERPEIKDKVFGLFGPGVLGHGGDVDRRVLAARVFADRTKLDALNGIVHPPVRESILERVRAHRAGEDARAGSPRSVLVLDVSLLATSPLRDQCDALVFVEAGEEARQRRCRARGWEPGEIERREAHQASLAEKRALARWTIDNSGTLEETRSRVLRLLDEIIANRPLGACRPGNGRSGEKCGPVSTGASGRT